MATHRDPTANDAIGRVMRDDKVSPLKRLVAAHPHVWAGLLPHEARRVLTVALSLANNVVGDVKAHHLDQARHQVVGR